MENQFDILWKPSAAFIEHSHLKQYERWLRTHKNLTFASYDALWKWSTEEVAAFWESLWEYFQVVAHTPYDRVLTGSEMPEVRWFEGATLNYAEHIFRAQNDSRPALIFQNERLRNIVPWAELEQEVKAMQAFLKAQGVGKGDCVAAYLPNIPQAIVCFLAVNSLGGVWSCCSPDFGVQTVIERFSQIAPCLFIAVDGYQYNGKPFDRLSEVRQIRAHLPTVRQTVFIPYLEVSAKLEESVDWETVLAQPTADAPLHFEPVPFSHPIWVLYSSGTTGKPKAITHSHGGVLLEHLKYMAFHNDVHEGEYFFWFTTTGWMMWNFLQASLLAGATAVLYDGSPAYPSMDVLWQLAQDLPIHHFGTSAPYLTACMKQGLRPQARFDLSHLRSIGSTGSPLPPEAFEWVYRSVSPTVWLCSMSGGTDVCTAFVGGSPYLPVRKGAIQARALGCALYAYDEAGNRIWGSLGEMVIEKPMPSMPIFFWNDPEGTRYRSSYFETYPHKWRHGDWVRIAADGGLTIQGRSDATLNRKGIRIGTAEIYSVLDGLAALKDALVLNLELKNGDDVMLLFVVLRQGEQLTADLQQAIRQALRRQCSPRHVPDAIHEVSDLPYTLSGKKMEVPIKKILMRMDAQNAMNRDAVRNPPAVDFFVAFAKTMAWDV